MPTLEERAKEIKTRCDRLRGLRFRGIYSWQVTVYDATGLGYKYDKRGQTPLAWTILCNNRVVAVCQGQSDVVYGSPMNADDSAETALAVTNLVCHCATHDSEDRPVDPGWAAEELSELAAMRER